MSNLQNDLINKNIIDLLNLGQLPKPQQAILLDKMTDIINQRLLSRISDSFDKDKQKELERFLDQGTEQELEDFIIKSVPDFLDILTEETLKLKNEVLGKIKKEVGSSGFILDKEDNKKKIQNVLKKIISIKEN
ncbi:hypothetical protein KJ785_02900 [Patescibacteria group bacterium]|nr:hypothetical protein [Patescibacteria group bacterium]